MLSHLSDEKLIEYYKLLKSDRKEIVKEKGSDTKFLYHIVRLFDEVEQLLEHGTMDLQRAKEEMKAIRRGDWTAEDVQKWAISKQQNLEKLYADSSLPTKADEVALRNLLLQCLEAHYGNLDRCIVQTGWSEAALREIDTVLDRYRHRFAGEPQKTEMDMLAECFGGVSTE